MARFQLVGTIDDHGSLHWRSSESEHKSVIEAVQNELGKDTYIGIECYMVSLFIIILS